MNQFSGFGVNIFQFGRGDIGFSWYWVFRL